MSNADRGSISHKDQVSKHDSRPLEKCGLNCLNLKLEFYLRRSLVEGSFLRIVYKDISNV